MIRRIVMTGANGFLGRSMLAALAGKFPESQFMLLSRSEASAEQMWSLAADIGIDNVRILKGDLDQQGLGLGAEDSVAVKLATDFWHVAGSTSFDDREREAIFRTNVGGTQHVVDLVRGCEHLQHFYHVSTAYVAGTAAGPMAEDELPVPPGFRNAYEESKWEGEKLVRGSGLPFTIFRPSIIIGDSQTYDSHGDTRMVYGYILGIYAAICQELKRRSVHFATAWHNGDILEVPLRTVGFDSSTKNFVCIDDAVRAIMAILGMPHVRRTFNLTSQNPLTLRQMRVATGLALGVTGLACGGAAFTHASRVEKSAMRFTRAFNPYTLNGDPVWMSTNTNQALGPGELIDMTSDLFERLLRHFVAHDIMASQHADISVS